MSAPLINWLTEVRSYLPWISFMAGMGGSIHCVGMCGGLVTATCEKSHDVLRYQVGRLFGYLILGAVAGLIGSYLTFKNIHPLIPLFPAIFIGLLFIFWGYQNFRGKKTELPIPKLLGELYTGLWRKLVQGNKNFTKAFFTGLISIFLPCGLLYGIVLSTITLEHGYEALFSMFFFWLGTVPSMLIAPKLIQTIIAPFKKKLPKTFAISLMFVGVLTISLRMEKYYHNRAVDTKTEKKMSCH